MPTCFTTVTCRLTVWLLCLGSLGLSAQQPLSVADLESWQQLQSVSIAAKGDYAAYVLQADKGDPTTLVVSTEQAIVHRFSNTKQPVFSYDGSFLFAITSPSEAAQRSLKKAKQAKKIAELDTLLLLDLQTGSRQAFPSIRSWKQGEKWSGAFAYLTASLLPDSLQKGLAEKSYRLVVRRPNSPDSLSIEGVSAFTLARDAAALLYQRSAHDSLWTDGVYYINLRNFESTVLLEEKGKFSQLSLSPDGQKAAFLSYLDTLALEQPPFHLHTWSVGAAPVKIVSGQADTWLPKGYRISDDGPLRFSDSGKLLYFGIAPKRPEKDSSLLEEEIVDVEVWTTEDPRMYTEENVLLPQERKRTYLSVYNWESGLIRPLGSPERANVRLVTEGDQVWILTYDERAYLKATTWEGGPARKDLYLMNHESGEERLIATAVRATPRWSPAGKYVYWYAAADTAWMAYSLADQQLRRLTSNTLAAFYDEQDDHPMDPPPHGEAAWLADDAALLLYDRYDWWQIDPSGQKAAQRLTNSRAQMTRLRYRSLDPDKKYLLPQDTVLVATFNESNYHSGYAWLAIQRGELIPLLSGPFTLSSRPLKPRLANGLLYTQEDFSTFPDLRFLALQGQPLPLRFATPIPFSAIANNTAVPLNPTKQKERKSGAATSTTMAKVRILSDANPQQADFAWGTAELFSWIDLQGRELRGILVKPADFDPQRQYPLIVNFYERSSEGVYSHRAPFPHRSSINYTHYASKGYVVFNPDVHYRIGYPGESAYDCVMSGVTALLGQGFIDRRRIGIQGHSWGGYQVAHLVTKTDLFACAESGAPVVNMFSAYGGIRWGTGVSRQFQYEKTQSRIGGSPWEYPIRYLENSPLFFLDKVNTPLLIMHNDQDAAVPWYQGIEYFTALRRLGKPAWLLNYRGEPHWPVKQPNRVDFQQRMSQFFDHYLLGKPAPNWMQEGLPPLRRGLGNSTE